MAFFMLFLNRYFGIMIDPMKNPINPISNVTVRLNDGLFNDSNRNTENNKRTISGLKI